MGSVNCSPYEYQIFADKAEYENSQHWMAPESLIPSGTFPLELENDDAEYEGTNTIVMTGLVIAVEVRTNPFTGGTYYWLNVQCLGLNLGVVLPTDTTITPPRVGNYIHGQYEVMGCICDGDEEGKDEKSR